MCFRNSKQLHINNCLGDKLINMVINWSLGSYLCEKQLKACVFFVKFLFFHQMIALQKLRKMFFISSENLFLFSRYSHF